MIRDDIAGLIREAIHTAQRAGALPTFELPIVSVERSTKPEWGDYSTSLPLKLASVARRPPLQIAQTIAQHVPIADLIAKVEAAAPGYVNLFLSDAWIAQQVEAILAAGPTFGSIDLGRGQKVQVEYVSANPTGPLHIGSGRNAIIGDALANVLVAAGYDVQREFYVNDAGSQMQLFYETLYARYAQALGRNEPIPEEGYRGSYVIEMGRIIAQREGDRFLNMQRDEAVAAIGEIGLAMVLEIDRADLELMGVRFDNWFSERSMYTSGLFDKMLTRLRERGFIDEREGAVWFASPELGEDKDAVLIRSTGAPTYLASDTAYVWNKLVERDFKRAIYVWGADHHGNVPRLKAVTRALGLDPQRAVLILYQLVTLKRGGEVVRLSRRTGDIVTLREVLEEVGSDAVRFLLLTRSADAQMDFDLELAKQRSEENLVYYVQYAHARIASILRYAAEQGVRAEGGDVHLLTHPAELALIRQMLLLPEVVELAATHLEPHHLTHYALDLAGIFHSFYKQCRVVSSDPADAALNKARLKLVQAAQIVLARTLGLLGVTAPESM
jgi:arginyl-tRNA synthetase